MEEYPFADLLVHCRDGFHSIPAMDDVFAYDRNVLILPDAEI